MFVFYSKHYTQLNNWVTVTKSTRIVRTMELNCSNISMRRSVLVYRHYFRPHKILPYNAWSKIYRRIGYFGYNMNNFQPVFLQCHWGYACWMCWLVIPDFWLPRRLCVCDIINTKHEWYNGQALLSAADDEQSWLNVVLQLIALCNIKTEIELSYLLVNFFSNFTVK